MFKNLQIRFFPKKIKNGIHDGNDNLVVMRIGYRKRLCVYMYSKKIAYSWLNT